MVLFTVFSDKIVEVLTPFFQWYQENFILGVVCYMIIYVIIKITMIPQAPLLIGGAFINGSILGYGLGFMLTMVVSVVSSTIGASIAFIIGKRYMREYIRENMISKVKLF